MRKEKGCNTGKNHDTLNSKFSNEGKYKFIKKIEVFHNNEGIFGLFPFYNSKEDKAILKNSFYNTFKLKYEFNILSKNIVNTAKVDHIAIEFQRGEVITSIKGYYDEQTQSIKALKLSTNFSKYSLGKINLLNNNKSCFNIYKDEHFIPGFRTSFVTDKTNCNLSYIGVYLEDNSQYDKKYFNDNKKGNYSYLNRLTTKLVKRVDKFIYTFCKILFVLFLIFFPFVYYYIKSQNIYAGDIKIKAPRSSDYILNATKIFTDEFGFVHIKADNLNDAMFTLGFASARDRLWQIDLTRRVITGRMSEIFGEKTVELDIMFRQLGLKAITEQKAEHLKNTKYYSNIIKYCEGINYYANNFLLPIEYQIIGAYWSEFTILDVAANLNMISYVLTFDWMSEIAYKHIESAVGKDFADLVFSIKFKDIPFGDETIVNDEELVNLGLHINKMSESKVINDIDEEKIKKMKKNSEKQTNENLLKDETTIIIDSNNKHYMQDSNDININLESTKTNDIITENNINHEDFNINKVQQGASNNWVISGKHTESGFPILSNDPHLPNGMPSSFYLVKLYLPDNIASGAILPGVPILVLGSTKHVSWGVTSENSDSVDLCEEKIDESFNYFNFDEKKHPLVKQQETIIIKNSKERNIEVVWTKNGPVLDKLLSGISEAKLGFKSKSYFSFRVSWYFNTESSLDYGFELLNAKNAKHMNNIIKLFQKYNSGPLLSFVWATKEGDIGYSRLGRLPIKKDNASNIYKKSFCKGWLKSDELVDILEEKDTPKLLNPKKGYIITANNRPFSENFIYNYHGLFVFARARRIRQLIDNFIGANSGNHSFKSKEHIDIIIHTNKKKKISLEDSIEILKDVKDVNAEYTLPKLIEIYERNNKKAYNEFNNHVKKMQEYQQIAQSNPNFDIPKNLYKPPQGILFMEHLKKWDFTMEDNSQLASIYSILYYNIAIHLFEPYISNNKSNKSENTKSIAEGIISTKSFYNFIYSLIDKVYSGIEVNLKQCSYITGSKNCEKYLVKIIDNLFQYIENDNLSYKGSIPAWSDLSYQHYSHKPFTNHFIFRYIFDRWQRSRGNFNTIKVSFGSYNNPNGKFVSSYSPGCQFLVDMKNPTNPLVNISIGNSGNVLSKYYDNRIGTTENADLVMFKTIDFENLDYLNSKLILNLIPLN